MKTTFRLQIRKSGDSPKKTQQIFEQMAKAMVTPKPKKKAAKPQTKG